MPVAVQVQRRFLGLDDPDHALPAVILGAVFMTKQRSSIPPADTERSPCLSLLVWEGLLVVFGFVGILVLFGCFLWFLFASCFGFCF